MASKTSRTGIACLLLAVTLLCLVHGAAAFPFGKSSAVTELTPASLPGFINTHKPVIILFYAPWCGHCKSFHSEYERFAEAVKGTMRVGAINADTHSSIGQQYGVRGFPTIKYWKMGTKSIASPQDYQGQRTSAALQSFMVNDITAAQVKAVSTSEQLKQAAREAPLKKVGVLFSAKDKVPPLLSVMALSPKLKELPLAFAGGCVMEKGIALSFNVPQLPMLGVLHYTPAEAGAEESFELVPYSRKQIAYEPVATFFLSCVEQQCNDGTATLGASAGATNLDGGRPSQSASSRPSASVALPVEPVDFNSRTIAQFCSPTTLKIRGQLPLCVISLTEHVSLANVHAHFQNDPLLFFSAAAHRAEVLDAFQEEFGVTLSVDPDADTGAVVVLRHPKPSRVRHAVVEHVNSDGDLQRELQKILNGEVRLDTAVVG